MKKQYINPKMETVRLNSYTLLAGSLTGDYVKGGNASADENLARESSFWDEEEDY